MPRNSSAIGMPMMSTSRPSVSETPVTTSVKYRMPVASDSNM